MPVRARKHLMSRRSPFAARCVNRNEPFGSILRRPSTSEGMVGTSHVPDPQHSGTAQRQQATSITDGGSASRDRKLKESTPRLARGRP